MKAKLTLFFFLCLVQMTIMPQQVYGQSAGGEIKRETCSVCGKLKQNCPYKGKHPKCQTCGKVKEQCPYNGEHPKPQPKPTPKPKPRPKPTITTNSDYSQTISFKGVSFKMIRVDGGTFTMGATSELGSEVDSGEKPTHKVTISTYYIGETEVTQALWKAVMGSNPSHFKGANHPVECVSWDDCKTFIKKLNSITGRNFRLPTEAEWEFAARGGNKSNGYKYSGSNTLDNVAWYCDNSGRETHNVKTKSPNELGIYDMSGNVYEWCEDLYDSSESDRVYRGGCWCFFEGDCRVSYRDNDRPNDRYFTIGLRLAL